MWSNDMPAYKQVQIRKVSMLRYHEPLAVGNRKNKWTTEVGFTKRAQKLLHILITMREETKDGGKWKSE